jgi:hypothetical protein
MGALPMPNSDAGASPVQTPVQAGHSDVAICQYRDARGRGCRMLAINPPNPISLAEDSALDVSTEGLCAFHARRLRDRERAGQATAAELLASVTDFTDPPSVNRFLGNLLKLVAVKRLPRRDAVAMAYISQLILNSQAAQDRRELMRLQIADLDAKRQKSLPTRVIWDLPRPKPQEQEASAGKDRPSEAPQPPPVPAASAPAQTDNHAAEQLPRPAAPPPPDRPALSDCPPAQPPGATSAPAPTAPASAARVPAAPPSPPKPIPGPASTGPGHTTDGFVSWAKPALKRYRYSRWY